ncbi:AraC family transcriptional regulator [Planomonospora sp. ID67723]|uniref:AraC family transcriptional regulator n=1 Tax=Planomonospora sp. ID67723 TaxID=2738134 RepID=UPI0018C40317|nr:AraC family transcriptional regulator [Planomonospora sp. ID67723]MBG0829752.1 AraC family transcriptional regulator [Planomonospora sp. ID67723]
MNVIVAGAPAAEADPLVGEVLPACADSSPVPRSGHGDPVTGGRPAAPRARRRAAPHRTGGREDRTACRETGTPDLRIGRFRPGPAAGIPHTHSHAEIAVVTAGEAAHHTPAGRHRVLPGSVILLPAGTRHAYEGCDRLELYGCGLRPGLLLRELAWIGEDRLLVRLFVGGGDGHDGRYRVKPAVPPVGRPAGIPDRREPVLDPQALADCVAHLDALRELAAESATSHRADLIGRLLLFLGVLTRAGTGPYGGDGAAEPALPPAVAEVIRLMESDLGHGWSLGELAEASFLTQGYLVRLFKASVGMPPMAYLMRLRAERAAMLLVQTDHPVSCIGHLVGWPDQNHFARRFRAHFGVSATSFRGNPARRPGQVECFPGSEH